MRGGSRLAGEGLDGRAAELPPTVRVEFDRDLDEHLAAPLR
ncbi:hypothetical protein [Allokutzneria multivorans]